MELSFASLLVIAQLVAIPVLYSFIGITDVQLRQAVHYSSTLAKLSSAQLNLTVPAEVQAECARGLNVAKKTAPLVPDFIFSDQLEEYFPIRLIHKTIDHSPAITKILDNHNIEQDELYSQFVTENTPALRYFIDNNLDSGKRIYVKFINKKKGFGAYTSLPITKGQPVINYVGMIVKDSKSDYSWWYPGSAGLRDKNGKMLDLGIDSSSTGNIARFVNHDEDPNLDVVIVPHKNRYHIVYVAKRFIPANTELTVSYGEGYWSERSRD